MLIYLGIQGILVIILFVLTLDPAYTHIPFGIDGVLFTVGQWIIQLTSVFWPLEIVFHLFFVFYLPVQITLLLLKFMLGHRAPGRDVS